MGTPGSGACPTTLSAITDRAAALICDEPRRSSAATRPLVALRTDRARLRRWWITSVAISPFRATAERKPRIARAPSRLLSLPAVAAASESITTSAGSSLRHIFNNRPFCTGSARLISPPLVGASIRYNRRLSMPHASARCLSSAGAPSASTISTLLPRHRFAPPPSDGAPSGNGSPWITRRARSSATSDLPAPGSAPRIVSIPRGIHEGHSQSTSGNRPEISSSEGYPRKPSSGGSNSTSALASAYRSWRPRVASAISSSASSLSPQRWTRRKMLRHGSSKLPNCGRLSCGTPLTLSMIACTCARSSIPPPPFVAGFF